MTVGQHERGEEGAGRHSFWEAWPSSHEQRPGSGLSSRGALGRPVSRPGEEGRALEVANKIRIIENA